MFMIPFAEADMSLMHMKRRLASSTANWVGYTSPDTPPASDTDSLLEATSADCLTAAGSPRWQVRLGLTFIHFRPLKYSFTVASLLRTLRRRCGYTVCYPLILTSHARSSTLAARRARDAKRAEEGVNRFA